MPRYTFGPFELDSEARTLRRDGEPSPVAGRALDVLILLVQNRGRLIDKDELLSRIWAGSVVEESSLTHSIFALRKVLGDSPKDRRYIATVAGRGYQFVAAVSEPAINSEPNETGRKHAGWFGRRNRVLQLIAVAAVLIALLVFWRVQHPHRHALGEPRLSRFTSDPGAETMPAFSPDGKQIAYVRAEHEPIDFMQGQVGQANIYTKLVGSESELRLTDHPGADYFPAWSPDGRYIAFYRDEPGASGIYLVSALGGAERRISTEKVGDGGVRWLPDGHHVVLSRLSEDSQRPALIEIALDTGQKRQMTFPPFGAVGDGWPAISPNGKTLAFLRGTKSDGVHACFMELASRQTLQCWPLKASWPEGVAWTEAGDGIIVSAMRGGAHRLWRYPVNGGAPAALTSGEEGAVLPAVSSRGNQLAYVLLRNNINLWQLDIEAFKSLNPDAANPITPSTRYEIDPAFSPDGRKIAFMSDRSGSQEIWVTDLATHSSTQLTQIEGPMTGSPSWSPDGSQIAFDSDQSGGNLFVISADGGTPRRIDKPSSGENCCPSWSRDGQFIYFASSRTGKFQVWKTSAAAGETSSRPAVQVTQGGGFRAFESADGQYLYYAKGREERGLWRRDLTLPGKEEPVLESLQDAGWWAPAPGVVYFLELPESVDHRIRLKALDTASLEVRELAALPYPVIRYTRAIAASRDGRHLAYVQVASLDSDIMLLQNFR